VTRIEALNLIDAGAGILGQVEDVDLAMTENNSHADSGMTQAIDASVGVRHGVVIQAGAIQQQIELPFKDARCCCAVGVEGREDVVVSTSVSITLAHAFVSIDRA